jgi:hypothetical protein
MMRQGDGNDNVTGGLILSLKSMAARHFAIA